MTPRLDALRNGPRPPARPLSLCVFCGSRPGRLASFAAAAHDVGTRIGQLGWQLVYGGGSAGLMGVRADAALASGARVIGVIPQSLMQRELGHSRLSELHVVHTMHERKRLMAERSDAFLALPGGIGTLEELFEVWTWRQLGYHDKPIGLLNTDGHYDKLLAFIAHTAAAEFLDASHQALLQVDAHIEPLLQRLGRLAADATAPDDYTAT